MARIAGGPPIDDQLMARMTDAIAHRGPNDAGTYLTPDRSVGLGNRRLSIIDLSAAGHMPMANNDRNIWITYNGEIFNFLDARRALEANGHRFRSNTDTEVLLRLYEERGTDCFTELNGMFAAAIWDERRRQLVLARDPFGIKPLYFAPTAEGQLAFASEVKSLIAGGLIVPEVDAEALHYYLNFLWVPGPKTMFKGVFKLQPGHFLIWKDGEYSVRRYWDPLPSRVPHRSEGELIEDLRARLEAAVRRHLISDVPLGVCLSGGLDSSSILALATRIAGRPMKAYTIAYRSEDARAEQSDEDKKYGRIVARQFDAEHHEIELSPNVVDLLPKIVWHMDEPVADPAAITSYLICKAARDQVTVLLSGQGGDEIFGGYRVHLADRLARPLAALPGAVRDSILLPLWNTLPLIKDYIPAVRPGKVMAFHRYFDKVLRGAGYDPAERYVFQRSYYAPGEQLGLYASEFRERVRRFDPYATHLAYFAPVRDAAFTDQMLYVDQHTFLQELNLTYSDKTSMAASVEVRVPLLDQEVVSLMRSVPPEWKIKGLKQKYLFKRAMEGILPESVIWRGKAGFGAPIRTWLKRDLRGMVRSALCPETLARRGYFDPKAIERMLDEDDADVADHTYRIWALLTLEVWHRTFVDQGQTS